MSDWNGVGSKKPAKNGHPLACRVNRLKDPRKLRFPLQSIELCMTAISNNQMLVLIDHFTKYAEALTCINPTEEEI